MLAVGSDSTQILGDGNTHFRTSIRRASMATGMVGLNCLPIAKAFTPLQESVQSI